MKSLRLHGVHQSQNFGDVHGGDTPRVGAIPRVLTARELEFLRLRQPRSVCPWGWGLCGWGRLWEGRNGAGKLEPTVAKETNELPGGGSVPSWPGNNRKQNGKVTSWVPPSCRSRMPQTQCQWEQLAEGKGDLQGPS